MPSVAAWVLLLGAQAPLQPAAWRALQPRPVAPTAKRASWSPSCLRGLKKVGRGRDAYWQLGSYLGSGLEFEVRLRLDANPTEPCLILSCMPAHEPKPRGPASIGHVLLASGDGSSILRGMFIREDLRGQGLSKLLLAIWLRLCLDAGVLPCTRVMNKPLLSLALTNFGFVPRTTGLSKPVAVTSTHAAGVGEPAVAGTEAPRQRAAIVGTEFRAPADLSALEPPILSALGGGTVHMAVSRPDVARALTLRIDKDDVESGSLDDSCLV